MTQSFPNPPAIVPNKKSQTDQFDYGRWINHRFVPIGCGPRLRRMVRVPEIKRRRSFHPKNTPIVMSELNGAAEDEETTDIVGLSPVSAAVNWNVKGAPCP